MKLRTRRKGPHQASKAYVPPKLCGRGGGPLAQEGSGDGERDDEFYIIKPSAGCKGRVRMGALPL